MSLMLPVLNLLVGNSMLLNSEQGFSSLVAGMHSLSGTLKSVALIRSCSGLVILITEKMPRDI